MPGLIFHLIPHTHWDREWYLPRAALQARLVAVTDDLIERLQAHPEYRSFLLDGQTVLVEDYLRARPDREADVRALVKTGRLQVGPWYVLADEQIPSGEGLVRNLLLGAADAERLGGRLDVLYSPDAFGHPPAWPTLAREFGIRYGVVWRGLGGEAGQERDLYRWRGLDEKEVVLWHLPRAGYEIGAALPADAERLFAAWAPVRGALVQRATGKHIPVFIGADHHGAHPDVPRLRDLLSELDPQSAFRVSRLDEFFQAATDGAKPAPLTGELRWSYRYAWTLQGVHGTRAPLKRRYSAAELALVRLAEPLAALARRAGGRDRRPVLELAWRALVRCQFHDAIAGCAGDDVARALESRLTSVEALAREVVRGSVHDLVHHDPDAARSRAATASPTLVVWNPAARPRRGVMIADVTLFRRDVLVGPPGGRVPREGQGYRPFGLATSDGHTVPVQVLDRRIGAERLDAAHHYPDQDEVDEVRIAFRAPTVPGLGLASAGLTAGAAAAGGARPQAEGALVKGRSLISHWIEVALEPTGALTLHDRRSGQRFTDLLRIEDGGDAGDTYSYCPPTGDRLSRAAGPIKVRRLAAGPLVAAFEARFEIGRRVGIRLVAILYADSPMVRCLLDIDNQAAWHRARDCPRDSPARPPSRGRRSAPWRGRRSPSIRRTIRSKRRSARRRPTPSWPRRPGRAGWRCSRRASSSMSGRVGVICWSPCSARWGSCRGATSPRGRATLAGPSPHRSRSARGGVGSSWPSRRSRKRSWSAATRSHRSGKTRSCRCAGSGCATPWSLSRRRSTSRWKDRGSCCRP